MVVIGRWSLFSSCLIVYSSAFFTSFNVFRLLNILLQIFLFLAVGLFSFPLWLHGWCLMRDSMAFTHTHSLSNTHTRTHSKSVCLARFWWQKMMTIVAIFCGETRMTWKWMQSYLGFLGFYLSLSFSIFASLSLSLPFYLHLCQHLFLSVDKYFLAPAVSDCITWLESDEKWPISTVCFRDLDHC
jgi:hypothetical protein